VLTQVLYTQLFCLVLFYDRSIAIYGTLPLSILGSCSAVLCMYYYPKVGMDSFFSERRWVFMFKLFSFSYSYIKDVWLFETFWTFLLYFELSYSLL